MTGEKRTDAEIRDEIASERAQLSDAVDDLRRAIREKRRPAVVAGRAVAGGLAATAVLRVLRRLRR